MSSFQHIPAYSPLSVSENIHLISKEEVHILSRIYIALDRERQERIIAMMHEMSFAYAKEKLSGKEPVFEEVLAAAS